MGLAIPSVLQKMNGGGETGAGVNSRKPGENGSDNIPSASDNDACKVIVRSPAVKRQQDDVILNDDAFPRKRRKLLPPPSEQKLLTSPECSTSDPTEEEWPHSHKTTRLKLPSKIHIRRCDDAPTQLTSSIFTTSDNQTDSNQQELSSVQVLLERHSSNSVEDEDPHNTFSQSLNEPQITVTSWVNNTNSTVQYSPTKLPKLELQNESINNHINDTRDVSHVLQVDHEASSTSFEGEYEVPACQPGQKLNLNESKDEKSAEDSHPPRKSKRLKINRNVEQVRQTPMGLPKPIRLPKKEFSVEEIYLNKNFRTPTEKKLETIFEFPKEHKDGSISNCEKRKKARRLNFFTDPTIRMLKKKNVKKRRRKWTKTDSNSDEVLKQKLDELDEALRLEHLSP